MPSLSYYTFKEPPKKRLFGTNGLIFYARTYFWARPIEKTYPKSNSFNRKSAKNGILR